MPAGGTVSLSVVGAVSSATLPKTVESYREYAELSPAEAVRTGITDFNRRWAQDVPYIDVPDPALEKAIVYRWWGERYNSLDANATGHVYQYPTTIEGVEPLPERRGADPADAPAGHQVAAHALPAVRADPQHRRAVRLLGLPGQPRPHELEQPLLAVHRHGRARGLQRARRRQGDRREVRPLLRGRRRRAARALRRQRRQAHRVRHQLHAGQRRRRDLLRLPEGQRRRSRRADDRAPRVGVRVGRARRRPAALPDRRCGPGQGRPDGGRRRRRPRRRPQPAVEPGHADVPGRHVARRHQRGQLQRPGQPAARVGPRPDPGQGVEPLRRLRPEPHPVRPVAEVRRRVPLPDLRRQLPDLPVLHRQPVRPGGLRDRRLQQLLQHQLHRAVPRRPLGAAPLRPAAASTSPRPTPSGCWTGWPGASTRARTCGCRTRRSTTPTGTRPRRPTTATTRTT